MGNKNVGKEGERKLKKAEACGKRKKTGICFKGRERKMQKRKGKEQRVKEQGSK